jgi:hypothetical protein
MDWPTVTHPLAESETVMALKGVGKKVRIAVGVGVIVGVFVGVLVMVGV